MECLAWRRKCLAKGIEVKDLRDVAQLRVVVHPHTGAGSAPWPGTDDKQLCYHVMGLVSNRLLSAVSLPVVTLLGQHNASYLGGVVLI
jgi:hypothetical protein